MIWLNSETVRQLPTPLRGMAASGIGQDGGNCSFDVDLETKHVFLARCTHKIQELGLPSSKRAARAASRRMKRGLIIRGRRHLA